MNTISNSNSTKWQSYQFEVEKYMEQMANNPYLDELEDHLFDQKYNKINTIMGEEISQILNANLINRIFLNFNNDKKLKILHDNIKNNLTKNNTLNSSDIVNISIDKTLSELKKKNYSRYYFTTY